MNESEVVMNKYLLNRIVAGFITFGFACAPALAQQPPNLGPNLGNDRFIFMQDSQSGSGTAPARQVQAAGGIALAGKPPDSDFVFFSAGEMLADAPVKNAPYSAEAVTEIIQSLADGNRIVRKTTVSVYRDSQGRTRRDQALGAIGPWVASGEVPKTSFINDPVAGTSYVLEHNTRTARQLPRLMPGSFPPMSAAPTFTRALPAPPPGPGGAVWNMRIAGPDSAQPDTTGIQATVLPNMQPLPSGNQPESLGTQLIEGVKAEGTRSVVTIPAGAIGNELPIEISSERWYSPELQTVVLSRRSDPRFGKTEYRLTNLSRSEPPLSLFEVPPDYTLIPLPQIGSSGFDECAASGNPVMESYPRQCRTPDGQVFVEEVPPPQPFPAPAP